MTYTEVEGRLAARLGFAPHITDARDGRPHTGALFALADQLLGSAVVTAVGRWVPTATLNLRMDWLAEPAPHAGVIAVARRALQDGDIAHVECDLYSEGSRQRIASAVSQFRVGVLPGGGGLETASADSECVPTVTAANFEAYLGIVRSGSQYVLPPSPSLLGVPSIPSFHGGAIGAALDCAAQRFAAAMGCNRPVTMTVNFVRPALAMNPLHIDVELVKAGRSVAFIRSAARSARAQQLVATCEAMLVKSSERQSQRQMVFGEGGDVSE